MGDTSNTTASASAGSSAGAASTPNYGGMGFTAAGGLASAYGNYASAQTNKRIAGLNAALASMQANQATQAGQYGAEQAVTRGRMVQGAQRAAQAGSGTVAGAGTGAAVLSSTEAATAADASMIRLNAIREAYGYQVKGAGEQFRGELDQMQSIQGTEAIALQTGAQLELESDPNYGGFRGRGMTFSAR